MGVKIFLVTGASFFVINPGWAQQETYLTHFNFNKVLYNPAYAGNDGNWCINMFHHRQWIGLMDQTGRFQTEDHLAPSPLFPSKIAPITQGFAVVAPFNSRFYGDKVNVGGAYFGFIDDVLAYEKNTSLKFGLAFNLKLGSASELRLGLDANYHTKRFNTTMLRALNNPDPLVPSGTSPSDSRLLLGSGLYFHTKWNSFFSGISVSSWNQPDFVYANLGGGITKITAAKHAYFIAGASFSRSRYKMQPVVMLKSARDDEGWVKPQLDAQCNVVYNNVFSAGAGFRAQVAGIDAVSFLLGFYPGEIWPSLQPDEGSFRIGYGYDITLQSLRLSSRNTHEIQVNYCFAVPHKQRKVEHPRDLQFHTKAQVKHKKKQPKRFLRIH